MRRVSSIVRLDDPVEVYVKAVSSDWIISRHECISAGNLDEIPDQPECHSHKKFRSVLEASSDRSEDVRSANSRE